MQTDRTTLLASLIVVGTGALWGFYWLPVRRLADVSLPGAWGSLAIVLAAAIMLSPFALANRRRLMAADRVAVLSVALGGAAFVLYSVGFVYGRVAIIILLFFLTPVWSTLIGRYLFGWAVRPARLAAIIVGLAGLGVMLSADGEVPYPRGAGEWLALASGILWSVSTTMIKVRPDLKPVDSAFVFALGACASALLLAPVLEPLPPALPAAFILPTLFWVGLGGALWWALSMVCLLWAASRLEPARLGILLMTEVLVGALSGAWLAGEILTPLEIAGGALVLAAGVLELLPARRRHPSRSPGP